MSYDNVGHVVLTPSCVSPLHLTVSPLRVSNLPLAWHFPRAVPVTEGRDRRRVLRRQLAAATLVEELPSSTHQAQQPTAISSFIHLCNHSLFHLLSRLPENAPPLVAAVFSGCHNHIPQTGGLEQQKLHFPHGSGDQRPSGLVFCERPLPGLQRAAFSVPSHGLSSVHTWNLRAFCCLSSNEDTRSIRPKPTFMTLFNTYYLLTGPFSKYN